MLFSRLDIFECATMLSLSLLFSALNHEQDLLDRCSFETLDFFIRLAKHLLEEIQLSVAINSVNPPHRLPVYVQAFIAGTLQVEEIIIFQLWNALKEITCAIP
jgi:hypothetical protein